jgi:uncharacterized membrane protein YbaN (DUF454 family)
VLPGRDPRRWLWLLLAWVALALGLIGVVIPGLPTTPFILLAAWAAARGSERLHHWLASHRVFGHMIRDWRREGAVSRRAKRAAILTMLLCALLLFLTAPFLWMAVLGSAVMAAVGAWLGSRPEPIAPFDVEIDGPSACTSGSSRNSARSDSGNES